MAKQFKNLVELAKHLQKKIDITLQNEVSQQVKEEMQVAISDTVYEAGEPKQYIRRGGNAYGGMGNPLGTGSLADQNEMKVYKIKNGIKIINEAKRNNAYASGAGYDTSASLTENIVYGYGRRDEWYNKPRDFISATRRNLIKNKNHVKALRDGLRKQGINVK